MNIERLTARNKDGIAYLVNVKTDEQEVDSPYKNTLKCILDCFERLAQYEEEAIARQSVKSEEVAEAIEWTTEELNDSIRYQHNYKAGCLDTIITALQAYQSWVRVEDRLPESGKHVLLCCEVRPSGKRYVCDGYYAKPKSIIGGDDGECSTEYDEETDEYYLAEGYYEIIKNWDDYSSIAIADFITHWMPLPEPPKGE